MICTYVLVAYACASSDSFSFSRARAHTVVPYATRVLCMTKLTRGREVKSHDWPGAGASVRAVVSPGLLRPADRGATPLAIDFRYSR